MGGDAHSVGAEEHCVARYACLLVVGLAEAAVYDYQAAAPLSGVFPLFYLYWHVAVYDAAPGLVQVEVVQYSAAEFLAAVVDVIGVLGFRI